MFQSRVVRGGTLLSAVGTQGATRNHGSGVVQAAPHRKQRQQRPQAASQQNSPVEQTPTEPDDKGRFSFESRKPFLSKITNQCRILRNRSKENIALCFGPLGI